VLVKKLQLITLAIIFFLLSSFQLPVGWDKTVLVNTKGQTSTIQVITKRKPTVFIFISPECPLCQSYTLTINQLIKKYTNSGIQFIGIVPGNDFSTQQVLNFTRTYNSILPIWFDKQLKLTKSIGATITPEVFFVSNNGLLMYSGRIDNWAYELSKKRKVITQHDLIDAIEAYINHKPITTTKTKAVGCFIE
jgi:thiol-disulfide isomerase/thioredoxin